MRRFLSIALLASVAIPSVAVAQNDNPSRGERGRPDRGGGGGERRAERSEQRAERSEARAERTPQAARVAPQAAAQPARAERSEWRGNRSGDADRASRRGQYGGTGAAQAVAPVAQAQPDAQWSAPARSQRGAELRANEQNRGDRRNWDDRRNDNDRNDRNVNRSGADGRRDWNDGNRNWNGNNRNWNRSWRSDNRYDWQRYRGANRNAFRLPRYYAPYGYGYGYRRFSIGATLFHGLFAQDYWIGDPYAYRLPPAYWPYQWVRYYDDALLVDTRSGYVVDVIEGIFW